MKLLFLLGFVTLANVNGACPYKVGEVWSCSAGTRPCEAIGGWGNKCSDQATCPNDCWSGSTCSECVCQDDHVANGLDQFGRQQCIEHKESATHILILISYGVILVVLSGFFIRTVI